MTKLNILDESSKNNPPNMEDYVKTVLRDSIPYIHDLTMRSVNDCNDVQRRLDPKPMSSWKPSLAKGLFYRYCEIDDYLKDYFYEESYNVCCLSIENIKIYIGKSSTSPSIVNLTGSQSSLFNYRNTTLEVDLSYTVDSSGDYYESFITYTVNNSFMFSFSLDSEYEKIIEERESENNAVNKKNKGDKDKRSG